MKYTIINCATNKRLTYSSNAIQEMLNLTFRYIKKNIQFIMISYSESFKIKWNYENWSWEKWKRKRRAVFGFAAKLQYKYIVGRIRSGVQSAQLWKIKTIPGGYFVIIFRPFIGKSFFVLLSRVIVKHHIKIV